VTIKATVASDPMKPTTTKEAVEPYKGNKSARQPSEPVDDFLARLPPRTSAGLGPWVWVYPQHVARTEMAQDEAAGEEGTDFLTLGSQLLSAYQEQQGRIEDEMQGKAQSSITRKLTPLRTRLREDLLRVIKEDKDVQRARSGKVCTLTM